MSGFILTPAQSVAMGMMAAPGMDEFMTFGGSRSGKTFKFMRAIVLRALRAPGSRHVAARHRRNAAMASLARQTLPAVMERCFPTIRWELNKSEGIAQLQGGSEIWIVGLDDESRIEKILGSEFATLFMNECSQHTWAGRNTLQTRLAQNVMETPKGAAPRPLKLRSWYDMNPGPKSHWTYRYFVQGIDPETRADLPQAQRESIGHYRINPADNRANLPAAYFQTLARLPERFRRRFEHGEFADDNPNALFPSVDIDRWRFDGDDDPLPDMQRIVIGVDPSGAEDDGDTGGHDEVGIVVAGLGVDGNGYVLEDLTVAGGPTVWGRVVATAYSRHRADLVVAERNFGGGMVTYVLKTARSADGTRREMSSKLVNASRGKAVRAEPLSPLVADGRIRFVGRLIALEDELADFSTHGFTGDRSPNRGDAFVFAMTELFSGIVNAAPAAVQDEGRVIEPVGYSEAGGWM